MNNDTSDDEECRQSSKIPLKNALDLESLLTGTTFDIDVDLMKQCDVENSSQGNRFHGEYISCPVDCSDDDEDADSSSFQKLASKMTNVTLDGKIKKIIKREGQGTTPPEGSFVSIFYFSYLEYNDEPTDSNYATKQFKFQLGYNGIPGLTLAVQTMKVHEKSLFLIGHEYAFGKMGHPPRIPPEATFLFQIELVTFSDSALPVDLATLKIDKKNFDEAKKIAVGLMEAAKNHFQRNNKLAIYEYNRAVAILDYCQLKDMSEQELQMELLLKLYTNLAVCYTRDDKPEKACSMCNNIYAMTKNTDMRIPSKVYFHNGRAHVMLGNYQKAQSLLLKAQSLSPGHSVITNELKALHVKMQAYENKKSTNQNYDSKYDGFRNAMKDAYQKLLNNESQIEFILPDVLNEIEINTAKDEAKIAGLKFRESKVGEEKTTFYASKV